MYSKDMAQLSYNQVLSDIYEETARDLYVYQTEYSDDVDENQLDYSNNELTDPEAFNEYFGDRGQPDHVIQPQANDADRDNVNYSRSVRTIVLNVDTRFRKNASISGSVEYIPLPGGLKCITFAKSVVPISNFSFNLSRLYKNITTVKLTSVEFNNSFYTFSTSRGNTSFIIQTNTTVIPITIPDGNYPVIYNATTPTDTTTLIGIIQSQLTATSITINYDITTDTVYFTTSSVINITILFPTNGLGTVLGFNEISYTSLNSTTNLYAENSPDPIVDEYIYIRVNDWDLLHHESMNQTYFYSLAKIQLPTTKNTVVFDSNYTNSSTKQYKFEKPINIQRLDVSVLDSNGIILNLRNDFSFTLELGQVNDSRVFEKLLED